MKCVLPCVCVCDMHKHKSEFCSGAQVSKVKYSDVVTGVTSMPIGGPARDVPLETQQMVSTLNAWRYLTMYETIFKPNAVLGTSC